MRFWYMFILDSMTMVYYYYFMDFLNRMNAFAKNLFEFRSCTNILENKKPIPKMSN